MRTHEVSYFIGIICRMLERARGDEGRLDNAAGVTVIVPVFNAKPYLPDLISSLGVQDYQGGEVKQVIFVDDGSTDRSSSLLQHEVKGWNSVLLRQANQGLSATRNNALEWLGLHDNGRCGFILFLDADDKLAPNALSLAVNHMVAGNLDQLFFTAASFFESESLRERFSNYETYYERNARYEGVDSGSQYMLKTWRNGDFYPSACIQMLRASFLFGHGISFESGIIHEDNLFTWR